MRNFNYTPLMRQWIGFDKLANALQNAGESQSFPPYNIEKSDDNHYRITLALAGFRQEDLEIQLEGTRLSVKGTPEQPKEEKKWLHQGLMNQPFSLSFTLAENMEVYSYEDGQGQIQTGQAVITLPDGTEKKVSEWNKLKEIRLENDEYWEKNSEDGCWYYSGTLSIGETALFLEAVTYPGLWDEAEGQLADPLPDGLTVDMLSIPITSEAVQAANIDVGDKTGAQAAMAAFAQAAQAQ